jgi:predicted MPP superfamily phosphohydrolase
MTEDIESQLERRLGRVHARQRLGIETEYGAHVFGYGINFFHIENWYSVHSLIRNVLKLTGLYWRGVQNTERIQVRHNTIKSNKLPSAFDGFSLLHISDLHVDWSQAAMRRLIALLPGLSYDICVLTGDYRGPTFGPFDAALEGLARMRSHITGPIYGVLGNHDTIRMVPAMETETIARGNQRIHLAGIDDAHYYQVDNIEKAASQFPHGEFAILLSHTPEVYRQAAHAGFDLMLAGHTHGGQICLPGAIPITLSSALPRRMGSGAWTHHAMAGYTSVGVGTSIVTARLNCPPEITLHHLQCG